jgi:hypothetical protein
LRLPTLTILPLALSLTLAVLPSAGRLTAGSDLPGLSAASLRVPAAGAVMFHFLRNIVRQLGRRVSRVLSLVLLRDVFPSLLSLISIFYSLPPVIDFVRSGRFGNFGSEFRMLTAVDFR